jgi:prevent-host-death family protein
MYKQEVWYSALVDTESVAISEARANLSEVVSSVRLLRRCVFLTQRGKRRAALVPVELGEAVKAAGGPDAALKLLSQQRID